MPEVIIVVGSNSVHTRRYINGICNYNYKQNYIHNDNNHNNHNQHNHHNDSYSDNDSCLDYNSTKIIFITNNQANLNELPNNVKLHTINFKLINLAARFQIARIISAYPNALIHIHQANSYAYHTLKAIKLIKLNKLFYKIFYKSYNASSNNLGYKVILTTWGSDILQLPQKNILLKHMVKFNLTNSNMVTSDSLYMSAKIRALVPNINKLYTINFGIRNFPAQLDLTQKEKIILSNRLHKPMYNIDKIIEAFAKLCIAYPDFKLVIAASGSETDKLKSLVASNLLASHPHLNDKQIIFTGMIDYAQLINWYRRAMLFISIPNSDATSLSLLEAMAYGCYPIVSNLPANLEWVINGINGIINETTELLPENIEAAINLSSEKISQAAKLNYSIIQQKAVFENNIQQFIELYNNISNKLSVTTAI